MSLKFFLRKWLDIREIESDIDEIKRAVLALSDRIDNLNQEVTQTAHNQNIMQFWDKVDRGQSKEKATRELVEQVNKGDMFIKKRR